MKICKRAQVKFPSYESKSVTLVGKGALNFQTAYGYTVTDDGLQKAYCAEREEGVSDIPQNVSVAYYSEWQKTLFVYADSGFYVNGGTADKHYYNFNWKYQNLPVFFDSPYGSLRRACFYADGNVNYFNSDSVESFAVNYSFSAGAYHCGRVLLAEDNSRCVRWSGIEGAHVWDASIDQSGWLTIDNDGGDILKLIAYKDDVIAIRQTALTALHFYGQAEFFTVGGQFLTADGIIGQTAALCNNCIYFCTESGFYAFDGNSVDKLDNDRQSDLKEIKRAVAFGDKYYVLCRSESFNCNVIFVYDSYLETGSYICLDADMIVATNDGVVAFNNEAVYNITSAKQGEWVSKPIDFGSNKLKFLQFIDVDGDSDVCVTVSSRGVERKFSGSGKIKVGMTGESFVFKVTGGNLFSLQATAEVSK